MATSTTKKKTTSKRKTTRRAKPKKKLVIVESPSKAKTIGKFLGRSYKVVASLGHVRDLPKSRMGVDIENDYQPDYISIRGKGDVIKELRKDAKNAKAVYLASDPDREGEAIAWHVSNILKLRLRKPSMNHELLTWILSMPNKHDGFLIGWWVIPSVRSYGKRLRRG